MGEVVPGTFREVRPAQPVWCWRNVGDARESGLLIAWRQEVAPDRRTYWHALVVTVEVRDGDMTTAARWYWLPHVMPVPNTHEDQHAAWLRWRALNDARAEAGTSGAT